MFERFTKGARAVVVQALAEARERGGAVDTQHLLIGVAGSPGDAARVLAAHGATPDVLRGALGGGSGTALEPDPALAAIGIDLEEVRRRTEAAFGPGALDRAPGRGGRRRRPPHVPFTPRAKQALERSLHEARARRDNYVGSEHVLLGLLHDQDATALLQRAGASPERVRAGLEPAGSRRGREA